MRAPLFLARSLYRRSRLRDAARLLPLVGLMLFLLPALGGSGRQAGSSAVYLFVVWALLILVAAGLAPRLASKEDSQPQDREDDI